MIKSTGESSMNAKTNESWRRSPWPNKRLVQVHQAAFPDHLLALSTVQGLWGRGRNHCHGREFTSSWWSLKAPHWCWCHLSKCRCNGAPQGDSHHHRSHNPTDKQDLTTPGLKTSPWDFYSQLPPTPLTHNPRLSHTLLLPTLPWV